MKKLSLALIGLMACLFIGVSTSQAQRFYTVEDLGVVKGMDVSQPAAINSWGQVAGTAYKGDETCAFHYDYITKFMDDAGGLNSRGFGINSTGFVVGDAFFETMSPLRASHAAFFKGGIPIELGVLKGQVYSRANGINASWQVVGSSGLTRDGTDSRAFFWTSQTGMVDIGTLGGGYAEANAINDIGYITGSSQTQDMGPMVTTHAFIYGPLVAGLKPMQDLGVLGGTSSYGMAINNYNHVVGYSTVTTKDDRVHAFLHDGKIMIDLGSLSKNGLKVGSDLSVALGINNFDEVVGYTYLPAVGGMPLQQVAFLWRQTATKTGQMINLNTLLYGGEKNYLLISATAINDNGQIVATAYDMSSGTVRAVMLNPAKKYPPPAP